MNATETPNPYTKMSTRVLYGRFTRLERRFNAGRGTLRDERDWRLMRDELERREAAEAAPYVVAAVYEAGPLGTVTLRPEAEALGQDLIGA